MGLFRNKGTVSLPEGCKGNASTIVEGAQARNYHKVAKVMFACPGIDMGALQTIYSSGVVQEVNINRQYRRELSQVAEVGAAALCATCPFNPVNQVSEDSSEVDRLSRDNS